MGKSKKIRTKAVKKESVLLKEKKLLDSPEMPPTKRMKVKIEQVKVEDEGNVFTKSVKSEPVKPESDCDSESDMSDTDLDDMRFHAKRREENMRLNKEFLENLGINEAKENILALQLKSKRPTQRGLKREKVPVEILPRRSSLRLQNKTPEGGELPPEFLIARAASQASPTWQPDERPPDGPLVMSEYLYGTSTIDEHQHITRAATTLQTKTEKKCTVELDRYISALKKTQLTEKRVAKVVPNRSFSLDIHPTSSKVLIATGDKSGKVGLWDVQSEEASVSDGVCCYSPHVRPVNCLQFSLHNPTQLYSCSYDGSLRCADFNKGVFQEVYSISRDYGIILRNFSFTSAYTMLVAQGNGDVALVDTRTPGTTAEHEYELHDRALRTVSVHPIDTHYFCTGGLEGKLCVWDLRNTKKKNTKPVCSLPHGRSVSSAYFSPVTGKYILSTCMDNTLSIYDTSSVGSEIKQKKLIRHNNHTGRWLTGFRATWHPAREDVFVVGSMNRPREIGIYSEEGKEVLTLRNEDWLGSICSLNALHPTLNIVAGVNSSGRVHVFM